MLSFLHDERPRFSMRPNAPQCREQNQYGYGYAEQPHFFSHKCEAISLLLSNRISI